MNLIAKAFVYVVAVFITDWLLPGIAFRTFEAGLLVALWMAVINIFIKPIIKLFAFPITLMTLGMFPFVLNTVIVLVVNFLVKDFVIFGSMLFVFVWATAFSFFLSLTTFILEQVTGYNLPGGANLGE
jgi:putative membrane protein